MSPLPSRVVLDNSAISTLQEAGALSTVLEFWPGQWLVPLEVMGEAARWRAHGAAVTAALHRLSAQSIIEISAIIPQSEGLLFTRLQRTLGQGESASIAIAFHRNMTVCLDDRGARRACLKLSPPVSWMGTEDLLGRAVRDSLLTRADAETIWLATGIRDPSRGIP